MSSLTATKTAPAATKAKSAAGKDKAASVKAAAVASAATPAAQSTLPASWQLVNARLPVSLTDAPLTPDAEGLARVTLTITGSRVTALAAWDAGSEPAQGAFDAQGGIVMPSFIDAHVHLDKGHIWPRAPNPDGTFASALAATGADRTAHWQAADVKTRMEFGLKCAYAHGTKALRTHLDSLGPQTRVSWPVFAELREVWAGRIDLQASPLFGIEHMLDDAHVRDVCDMIESCGGPSPTLGAVAYMGPDLHEGLDRMFRIASDNGWNLDFHADETNNPDAAALRAIAQTALQFKFQQRILAGHCCSLAVQSQDEAAHTIALVAQAGISVVSLPICNMYLQDRAADRNTLRTPRWRGVTPLQELKAAGVDVMIASDNTRDPFLAYGDLDMLEVWREGTRILHLDHPFSAWADCVTAAPAHGLGLDDCGRLQRGGMADFTLFRARSMTELFARPQSDRAVYRAGVKIAAALPDYQELDHLLGLAV